MQYIKAKKLPATNTKGARVKVSIAGNLNDNTIEQSWNYSFSSLTEQASDILNLPLHYMFGEGDYIYMEIGRDFYDFLMGEIVRKVRRGEEIDTEIENNFKNYLSLVK